MRPDPPASAGILLGALLRLGRPHFLAAGVGFVALGATLAHRATGDLDALAVALAQATVTCTQWAVHYANDAHDAGADRDNPNRTFLSGGSGVLVLGTGAPALALALALARALFVAAAVSALLLAFLHPVTLPVSACILLLSWAYSAPPLRLVGRGVGELAAGVVVAGLVPGIVLVAHGVPFTAWLPLAPLIAMTAAAVLAFGLPDLASDAAVGKRTLAVRLGPRRTRRVLQVTWVACGLAFTGSILAGAPTLFALVGGIGYAAAVALPALVHQRRWLLVGVAGVSVPGVALAVTLAWALGLA